MSIFSDNLKALRGESGLKQAEIAELVGITASTWSNYEIGKTEPNLDSLAKIANAFGVSVDTLINRDVSLIAKALRRKKTIIKA